MESTAIPAAAVCRRMSAFKENIESVVRGKGSVVDRVLVSLLASGHVLIEDLPGLGKTTLAYCLARSVQSSFSRIQFTSDLLPSDVLGVSVYDERERDFVFKKGPVFSHFVLADEINRTTPKTQSALLEVMDRAKVSADGETYAIGAPFMVFATQNPVDFEATFPLPDSQMDRFFMRLQMGYPDIEVEREILESPTLRYDELDIGPVVTREELVEFQSYVPRVFVEDTVLDFILKIISATRTQSEFRAGVSTRGSIALKLAAQATALYHGRSFVVPEDVYGSVIPVLAHRLGLRRRGSDPIEERHTTEGILKRILESIPAPA